MRNTLFIAFVFTSVVSSAAHATAVCAGDGVSKTVTAAAQYVKKDFSAKCSANVFSNYSETNNAFGVVAGSKKGKHFWGGGTGGGGIVKRGDCDTTAGCTATEITDAASLAALSAS